MANKISTFDLKRLLHGWTGAFELSKQAGNILYVEMLYTINEVKDFIQTLDLIKEFEELYENQILYECNTSQNNVKIKVKVTPQTLNNFFKIKNKFKEIENLQKGM
ncbi:hypothetical protein [Calidifontibacillus erzurumensis]|uniref:hypothetical protein n=1 Tax=Calidifontibacillus erzurumensis TaxID=2741433 RepID=UPI0035B54A01